jgi:sulfur carrier protein
MQIILNGSATKIPDKLSAAGLVEHLELGDKRLAIEINREIVPRSQYEHTALHPNDNVEIVHAIGGG